MRVTEAVKREIRAALIREGERLFREQGFAATTVDQVTAAAGVSKGTFYNYFTTKEDLALAIVLTLQGESAPLIQHVAGGPEPIQERLTTMMTAPLAWITANPELTMVWCQERIRRGRVDGPSQFNQGLVQAFTVGQQRGEIRTDRPAVLLAGELEGMLLVYIIIWYHSGLQFPIQQAMPAVVETYLHGAAQGGN